MNSRVIPILLGSSAFWPLLPWYLRRLSDGSEDSLGLLALITALGMATFGQRGFKSLQIQTVSKPSPDWLLLSGLLLGYILLLHHAPNLVLAIVMVLSLWLFLERFLISRGTSFSILGLLLLSLPIVSSLNFFAGFPLRLGISHIVAFLLSISGFSVELTGTMLSANRQVINIDAPCAGIHFLWFSAYFGLLLAYWEQASFGRTLALLFIAGSGAIVGNVFRSLILSLLYLSGFAAIADNSYVHEGLGAACFVFTIMLILLATKLSYEHPKSSEKTVAPLEITNEIQSAYHWRLKLPVITYCLLCVVAASAPLVQARSVDASLAIKPDQWHDRANRCNLKRIPLTAMEKQFQSRFPGDIAKFSDGQSEVIFRTIKSPTRQLHPAEDCLKGSGYVLSKDGLTKDEHGVLWHTLQAQRGDKSFKVSERIIDHHGQSWLRVSDWYWAAVIGQTKGPWMSITKMSPISKG